MPLMKMVWNHYIVLTIRLQTQSVLRGRKTVAIACRYVVYIRCVSSKLARNVLVTSDVLNNLTSSRTNHQRRNNTTLIVAQEIDSDQPSQRRCPRTIQV